MEPAFNQAEDMLRRVSPEGRALAHRQRIERQRRTSRQLALVVLLAILIGLVVYGISLAGIATGSAALSLAALLFVGGCVAIFLRTRSRSVKIAELPAVPLAAVPERVAEWLEQQRKSLPAPLFQVVDGLNSQLSSLGPQLRKLEPNDPGSVAIRKLIAMELPELVERYRNIPSSAAQADSTAQLSQGLEIISGEIRRISRDLASGSFDALATQNRYLQLKYDAGLGGS